MQIVAVLLWFLKVVNEALNAINAALGLVNHGIDILLPWLGLVGIIGYSAYSLVKNIKKYGQKKKAGKDEDGPGEILSRALNIFGIAIFLIIFFWWSYSGGIMIIS